MEYGAEMGKRRRESGAMGVGKDRNVKLHKGNAAEL